MKSFLGKFTEMAQECDSDEFSISVDYKLALTKSLQRSDLSLSLSDGGEKAIIIRETKDQMSLIHIIRKRNRRGNLRQEVVKITSYSFQAVVKKPKHRKLSAQTIV
ncbi:hypothetical protein O9993_03300 [Vibrio lentus]|nr:hypothetical protein [Vibrio lentus]